MSYCTRPENEIILLSELSLNLASLPGGEIVCLLTSLFHVEYIKVYRNVKYSICMTDIDVN